MAGNLKILYFDQYYPPEKASGLDLVQDLLEGFAKVGWQVEMYVPLPTRGVDRETRNYYKKHRIEKMYDENVVVHRMNLYREGKGVFSRAFRYLLFSLECYFKTLKEPAEVVFTGSGPPTQGWIVGKACRRTGKKLIYNLQDIFPDSLVTSGICSTTSPLMRIGRKIETKTYKNATHIITISNDMKRNILEKGVPVNKVSVVQNWIDTDRVRPVPKNENKIFDDFNLPRDDFYVVYAGNIGKVQGIDVLITAAEKLKDVHFVIFGNGSEEVHIKQLVKDKNLNNISLFPLQPVERVPEVYGLGDICFISCRPGTGKSSMPSKTWTIMACGVPIVASFDLGGEMENTLKNAQCGVCVEAGNSMALVHTLQKLKTNRDKLKKMGRKAREYALNYASKRKCVGEYINIIFKEAKS